MEAISRAMTREISRTMSGVMFEVILKVKIDFESIKDEDNKQQTKLEKVIEDIWKLMQMPKESYKIPIYSPRVHS